MSSSEMMEREWANQDRAKNGGETPVNIQVISDPREVELLRTRIKKETVRKHRAAAKQEKTEDLTLKLAKQYRAGEPAVVPQILRILQGRNAQQKNDMFMALCRQRGYNDDEYTIREPQLINEIFKAVDDTVYEKEAVQLVGFLKIKGYEQLFEKKFLSGTSLDPYRIFFWLAEKGTSIAALTYVEKKIAGKKLTADEVSGILAGLSSYGQAGNAAVRQKVSKMAFAIYNQHLIPAEEFEELKKSAYSSSDAEYLLECILNYGDKEILPVAQQCYADSIRQSVAVQALLRLEGAKYMEKVYSFLRSDDFYDGLFVLRHIDRSFLDDQLLKEVIVQFSRRQEIDMYDVDRVVAEFMAFDRIDFLMKNLKLLNKVELEDKFVKAYTLRKASTEGILEYLLANGIILQRPSSDIIKKAEKDAEKIPSAFITTLLEQMHLSIYFDAETDMQPVDYDNLLNQFAENSQGVLNGMTVLNDVEEAGNTYKYTISTCYKDRGFVVTVPDDIGDWYDVRVVEALLEEMFKYTGSSKRFVPVGTGDQTVQYIFGEPAKIKALIEKYDL